MRINFKSGLVLGLCLFAFVFAISANTASATLTMDVSSLVSTGALTLTGAASSIWDLGAGTMSLQTAANGPITTGTGTIGLNGPTTASTAANSTSFTVTNNTATTATVASISGSGVLATTGNLLTLTANGLTTGTGLIIPHTTSVIASGGSLLRLSSTSIDTGTTNGTLLDLSSSASTAGTLGLLTDTALTTGVGLKLAHTTAVIASGGSLERLSSTSIDTGTTTGNLLDLSSTASTAGTQVLQTYSGLTGGIGEKIVTNALTTGTAFIIPHTTSVIASGGSLLRLSSTSIDTSTTTGTLLDLSSSASTAGTLGLLTDTALTTGVGLKLAHTTAVIASGGSLERLSSTSIDTGTTTGNLLDLSSTASTAGTQVLQTYSGLTGGIGESIVTNALTTGTAFIIPHTTSVIASGGSLARISSTSIDTGTTTGNLLDLSSTASTAGTQILGTFSGLTGGIGESIVTNALTTGTAFIIPHTTSVIASGGSLLRLSSTSADTGTTTGNLLDLNSSASTAGVVAQIKASALIGGTGLLVIGSAPATMTAAGSIIRANDGTNDVFRVGYNGHITSTQTTVPSNAGGGSCTGQAVAAGSTDVRGTVTTTSCTASQTITVTFNKAYANAPICMVSPANAAAAVTASAAAITFASASTTILTITTPAAATTGGSWYYMCIE